MTVIATALKHLIAAGMSGDDLVRAVADMEAATDTRSTGAKRQQRYRDNKAAKRNEASQSVTPVTSDVPDLPPNDIYSNPPSNPSEAKASEPPFAEKVVSAWNDDAAAAGAQRSNPLTPKRRKHLAARVREVGEAGVLAAIRGLAASAWHTGHGSNGWRADLGWLLENAERIAKFSERADAEKPTAAPVADTSAYLAKIAAQPWMRGRENELEPQPKREGRSPPRGFGQLAAGIAGGVTVQ